MRPENSPFMFKFNVTSENIARQALAALKAPLAIVPCYLPSGSPIRSTVKFLIYVMGNPTATAIHQQSKEHYCNPWHIRSRRKESSAFEKLFAVYIQAVVE